MRLLDTITGQFIEKDPRDAETTYAILSHTWDSEGEQTYPELREIQNRYALGQPLLGLNSPHLPPKNESQSSTHRTRETSGPSPTFSRSLSQPSHSAHFPSALKEASTYPSPVPSETPLSLIWDDPSLSPKIREACVVARGNGYRYIWIDSCCIDKTSSSELSEAINSMYEWYTYAHICYAFLADVPTNDNHRGTDSRFRRSRWFTRGWTLQELIAPLHVVFLSEDWAVIGSKLSLASLVTDITGIGYDALLHLKPLGEFSVAQRLSWASRRKTTRVEDQAYSLLGLFDIHMPTIYGEGEGAFRRLQEEIMRRIPDQSLFAWTSPLATFLCETSHPYLINRTSLLAPSLHMFRNTGKIGVVSHDEVVRRLQYSPDLPAADYSFTSHGIRTQLPMIPLSRYFAPGMITVDRVSEMSLLQWYLVILGCEHEDLPGRLLARICYIPSPESNVEPLYVGHVSTVGLVRAQASAGVGCDRLDLLPLSQTTLKRLRRSPINCKTVYISYPHRRAQEARELATLQPHETISLVLPKKMRDALRAQGYAVSLRGPDPKDFPTSHYLMLSHYAHTIVIEYEHTLEDDGENLLIKADVKTLPPLPGWAFSDGLQFAPHQPEVDSAAVFFTSSMPWPLTLGRKEVLLKIPAPGGETMLKTRISLELDLVTKDHYSIHVDTRIDEPTPMLRRRTWEKWLRFGKLKEGDAAIRSGQPVQECRY